MSRVITVTDLALNDVITLVIVTITGAFFHCACFLPFTLTFCDSYLGGVIQRVDLGVVHAGCFRDSLVYCLPYRPVAFTAVGRALSCPFRV